MYIQIFLFFPQAINAEPFGVIGVLVYTDPLDINDGLMSDINETYPHSWYLPPSGVERGSFNTQFGDLLTPYLAAKGNHCLTATTALNAVILGCFILQRRPTESQRQILRISLPFQYSQSDLRMRTY